jgi:anti-sigma factor RsiW
MSERDCGRVRDILPDWVLGNLDPESRTVVERHILSCRECAREEEVLRGVLAARPSPPADLEARIQARVRAEMVAAAEVKAPRTEASVIPLFRRRRWAPAWALSAAAVAILSLGIGVMWNGAEVPEVGVDPIQVTDEEPIPEAWLWDDGMVAGAPVYDGLTDEQLEALIQELEG